MSDPAQLPDNWINSLLEQLQLVHPKRTPIDLRYLWAALEESRVLERIRLVVAEINNRAGHPVLQLLDYLPPQRSVIRVVYTRKKVEFVMALVLLSGGPAVTFHSARIATTRWDRYIPGRSGSREHEVEVMRGFRADEITDAIIRGWISFLISGFSREFEAALRQPLPSREDRRSNPFSQKASA